MKNDDLLKRIEAEAAAELSREYVSLLQRDTLDNAEATCFRDLLTKLNKTAASAKDDLAVLRQAAAIEKEFVRLGDRERGPGHVCRADALGTRDRRAQGSHK